MLRRLFSRVTYTCDHCVRRQGIPLGRIHFFERVHGLTDGQVVLIVCPACAQELQIPTPYPTHTGHHTRFDPHNPDNAVIHAD